MKRDPDAATFDLASIRARLAGAENGRAYWRRVEELANTEGFPEFIRREFPRQAAALEGWLTRREFLKLLGVAMAMAGVSACTRRPVGEILPYVRQPAVVVPGIPLVFATAATLDGAALGLLVKSSEGRPTKVEGNPAHPASLGATDAFAQASVLALYDPDRSRTILKGATSATWDAFVADLAGQFQTQRVRQGAGLRILTETVTSPTLASQLRELQAAFPRMRWHRYDPLAPDNSRSGSQLAFGEYVDARCRMDRAEVVLSLGGDFLFWGPGRIRYARDFISRRRVRRVSPRMNRLYVVETTPSITGAVADHRLTLRPAEVEEFARALAAALGLVADGEAARLSPEAARWLPVLARDLLAHRGACLVLAGLQQPPMVHTLTHAMNDALGNVGRTVDYIEPIEVDPVVHGDSLRALVQDMDAGRVEVLIIIGGNPTYTAPADLQFAGRLARVPFSVHLSPYDDETSKLCSWHIPQAHELESWGDARAYDGTASIIQPLIAPLYGGRTAHELIAALQGQPSSSGYEIVRAFWKAQLGTSDFEQAWRTALTTGVIAGTARPARQVRLRRDLLASLSPGRSAPAGAADQLEIAFLPDYTVWDGRFANIAWLQELPKPLTTLTWDNAALIAQATAEQLQLRDEDVVDLRYRGRTARAPVLILPGHAAGTVTVTLGYGRMRAGAVAAGLGFNAYALRTSDAPWFDGGLRIERTNERRALAVVDQEANMEGRDLVQVKTLRRFRVRPGARGSVVEERRLPSLYPGFSYAAGHAWGMSVDLTACIGCNACVVACQAENNVPSVGKQQVRVGRHMHWLRIDRYYTGEGATVHTVFQPVPCMHCENAPCELVCPVAATVHSDEGLNQMIYNRCIGTRYCSNNCPYKVRRFNFLQFADLTTPSLQLVHNPDVTVRSRGVMEKCTYCVQRIAEGKITAEREGRPLRDGEVKTACQQACPAEAIVFGDLNDRESRAADLRAQPQSYALLAPLNTQPRTTYLARIRNPNLELEPGP
jgi:MoCo/4Fe-4S cofactor protein with predicted Tat translocation signal